MKASSLLLATLGLAALCSTASAHPGHATAPVCYIAFWKGVLPESGTLHGPEAGSTAIWSKAFVSKYRIVGMGLPDLAP
jgi:hypothetical protein